MRSLAIAQHLSEDHEVWLTEGGAPVPHLHGRSVTRLRLPSIQRLGDSIVPLNRSGTLAETWDDRGRILCESLERLRPDIVVVEHYPFSKWELSEEIRLLLNEARRVNPRVQRIASVRDIPLQTKHERCSDREYAEEVIYRLNTQFDGLMVHSDPAICQLRDSFSHADRIRIPVQHTGIVCIPGVARAATQSGSRSRGRPGCYALASIGGGSDDVALLERIATQWGHIRESSGLGECEMVMFQGLRGEPPQRALPDRVSWRDFSPEFTELLHDARLSISCAGYNTCATLLSTGTPALLVPNTRMSDQVKRARLLQSLGLAEQLSADRFTPELAAAAIRDLLNKGRRQLKVNLEGAQGSRQFIEKMTATARKLIAAS